MNLECKC